MAQSLEQSSTASSILRIGSRGSPLALAQAREVQRRLAAAGGLPAERIEIKVIRTTGDIIQDRPLTEAGGKGVFTKEIEEALLSGAIDLAVHSSKDIPAVLPAGLVLSAFLPREDARDALIARTGNSLRDLRQGAAVGTASPRRQALVKRMRPDLAIVPLRGNVETRLRKAETRAIDATLIALAGLKRLGLAHRARAALDLEAFLPAVGQGAIALTARAADARTLRALAAISDEATMTALTAERAFLAELSGSCRAPVAGHARIVGGGLTLLGQVLRGDGSETFEVRLSGAPADAALIGGEAGRDLAGRLPRGLPPSRSDRI